MQPIEHPKFSHTPQTTVKICFCAGKQQCERHWAAIPRVGETVRLSDDGPSSKRGTRMVLSVHWGEHVAGNEQPIVDQPMVVIELGPIRKGK
jgi:hypothetical protein